MRVDPKIERLEEEARSCCIIALQKPDRELVVLRLDANLIPLRDLCLWAAYGIENGSIFFIEMTRMKNIIEAIKEMYLE